MNPLISEFQIPIANVLENMHVISDSQLMVVTVDRSIRNIPLSSSYQCDLKNAEIMPAKVAWTPLFRTLIHKITAQIK